MSFRNLSNATRSSILDQVRRLPDISGYTTWGWQFIPLFTGILCFFWLNVCDVYKTCGYWYHQQRFGKICYPSAWFLDAIPQLDPSILNSCNPLKNGLFPVLPLIFSPVEIGGCSWLKIKVWSSTATIMSSKDVTFEGIFAVQLRKVRNRRT